MYKKKLFGTATVGTKGQIVIPADAREEYGLSSGERLYVVGVPDKRVMVLIKEEHMSHLVEHAIQDVAELKTKIDELEQDK
tara:strand:- start:607 stop:849 length:243 start_codon:yes stop_codon:yes gene_type:complete